MKKGIIVKGIGGFYYIKCDNEIFECRARGRFRNENIKPLVGDYVKFSLYENSNTGIIEEILNRKIKLLRPPVANVEQAIIVFAAKNPEPNMVLLDKMLILGESVGLKLNICINKVDLDDERIYQKIQDIYKNTDYNVIFSSTKSRIGINEIKDILKDKITVFAGPSGVGKSSILNAIQENLQLKTGDISKKIKRGKHTTRHTELLELDFGGWVVDTPGFTSLNIDFIDIEDLPVFFPEFRQFLGKCKFVNCMHIDEPECEIKKAVIEGFISNSRYDNYATFAKQISENKNRRY